MFAGNISRLVWPRLAGVLACQRLDELLRGASLQRSAVSGAQRHMSAAGQVPSQARGANRGGAVAPLRAVAARGRPRRMPPSALAAARRAAVAAQRRCSGRIVSLRQHTRLLDRLCSTWRTCMTRQLTLSQICCTHHSPRQSARHMFTVVWQSCVAGAIAQRHINSPLSMISRGRLPGGGRLLGCATWEPVQCMNELLGAVRRQLEE